MNYSEKVSKNLSFTYLGPTVCHLLLKFLETSQGTKQGVSALIGAHIGEEINTDMYVILGVYMYDKCFEQNPGEQ